MSEEKIYKENSAQTAAGLPCHVVRDLLPLYIDGLTADQTSRDIRCHLDGCEDCSKQYKAMTAGPDLPADKASAEHAQAGKEIDYLKKVKKRSKLPAIIIGCIALLAIGALVARFLIFGSVSNSAIVRAEVEEPREVYLTIELPDSAMAISGTQIEEKDGVITVRVKTCLAGLRKSGRLATSYTARSDIKQIVDANGKVLWENGRTIEAYVANMFQKKVKYIGNAPAVGSLVNSVWIAGVDLHLKDGMQLKTDKKPYTLILNTEAADNQTLGVQHKHAILLLALIENLDRVEYMYQNPSYKIEIPLVVNAMDSGNALEQAKKLAMYGGSNSAEIVRNASSIKDFGKSASALQALVDVLEKDPNTAEPILNEEFFRAIVKLELKTEDLSVIGSSFTTQDAEGNRSATIGFVNGDVLNYVCRRDRVMISASYTDKAANKLYSWEDGQDGVTIKDL